MESRRNKFLHPFGVDARFVLARKEIVEIYECSRGSVNPATEQLSRIVKYRFDSLAGFREHPLGRISVRPRQWQILYYTNPGISMCKVHDSNT